tara:strand:- start:237 stop:428 length:192 start_codon:yes stop_codon:yes gene_type:complete
MVYQSRVIEIAAPACNRVQKLSRAVAVVGVHLTLAKLLFVKVMIDKTEPDKTLVPLEIVVEEN